MSRSSLLRRASFRPICGNSSAYYACDFGSRFVGCCSTAPCDSGCPDNDLYPGSFDRDDYANVPGASCPSKSQWWTCQTTEPTFFGCCVSNPCEQGECPQADLRAAMLPAGDEKNAFWPLSTTEGSITASTATSSATAIYAAASASPSSYNSTLPPGIGEDQDQDQDHSSLGVGAIAGIAVGAILLAILITFLTIVYRRKKKEKQRERELPPYSDLRSPLPMYSSLPKSGDMDKGTMISDLDKGTAISELESPPQPSKEWDKPQFAHSASQRQLAVELEAPILNHTQTDTYSGATSKHNASAGSRPPRSQGILSELSVKGD